MASALQQCEVVVTGIPPSWSDEEIDGLFSFGRASTHEGEVERICLESNGETVIVFKSKESAQLAIEEMEGMDFTDHEGGGIVHCEMRSAAARPKPSRAPSLAPQSFGDSESETDSESADDDTDNMITHEDTAVWLRGLPFSATIPQIMYFLGPYAQCLDVTGAPITIEMNRRQKPSGFACVRFATPHAASDCCRVFHRQMMGKRYIEVVPFKERRTKQLHQREKRERRLASKVNGSENDEINEEMEDRLIGEIQEYLSKLRKIQGTLGKLGEAISKVARTYLREQGVTLKAFLERYPELFCVQGQEVSLCGAPPVRSSSPTASKRKRARSDISSLVDRETPAVRLRGLPFKAVAQEVVDFFSRHGVGDRLAAGADAVQLVSMTNGLASGEAVVKIRSFDDVSVVRRALDKQHMGERYIEVFALGDGAAGQGPSDKKSRTA
eukprot:TRINITY_DN31429_c0_g1_i1.p1 TRINITY_DN31429_c0_g1~~TRINITY_DN31429_c0_g1_i1.p1  ORF type:complete len:441 (-),score=46.12 TRINITY_DN31429_c0_g1_i1:53-1375(-)